MLRLSLRVFSIGLFLALLSLPCSAAKLHLLVVVDSNDRSIGTACRNDGKHVSKLFWHNVAYHQLTIHRIVADNPETIRNRFVQLNVAADDSVCFYFSGHGSYNSKDGHQFTFSATRQSISRDEVRELLKQTGAKLTVLLTDCCFNYLVPQEHEQLATSSPPAEVTQPIFDALFFQASGAVDISSSQKNEVSLVYPNQNYGSVFTSQFVAYFKNRRNQRPTWQQLFDQVSQDTETVSRAEFSRLKTAVKVKLPNGRSIRQTKQTPMFFGSLPGGSTKPITGQRFGVTTETGRINNLTGAVITKVTPGSPADNLRLRPGDGIITFNNIDIESNEQFRDALKSAPRETSLTFGRQGYRSFIRKSVTLAY